MDRPAEDDIWAEWLRLLQDDMKKLHAAQERAADKNAESSEKILDAISRIDITMARQEVVLEDHTRRSLAAEENIKILRDDLKPVEKHVTMVNGFMKVVLFLAGLVAAAAGVRDFFVK